jgi:hypothetical protein
MAPELLSSEDVANSQSFPQPHTSSASVSKDFIDTHLFSSFSDNAKSRNFGGFSDRHGNSLESVAKSSRIEMDQNPSFLGIAQVGHSDADKTTTTATRVSSEFHDFRGVFLIIFMSMSKASHRVL